MPSSAWQYAHAKATAESPEIRAALSIAADADDASALGAVRAAKDSFR